MNHVVLLIAVLCLGLSAYNAVVGNDVRTLSGEFQQRQTTINQSVQYKQLNNQLITALANVAASDGDESIREMLTSEGVTYTVNTPPAPAAEPEEGGDSDE